MGERRISRNSTWTPQAIAIVSCAVALLAAQPVGGAGQSSQRGRGGMVTVRECGAMGRSVLANVEVSGQARRKGGTREVSLLGSARRLHVLATVEILQRLLVSELSIAPQVACLTALDFDAVWVGTLPPVLRIEGSRHSF